MTPTRGPWRMAGGGPPRLGRESGAAIQGTLPHAPPRPSPAAGAVRAGLVLFANGQQLAWMRDSLNVHAFHVQMPEGVTHGRRFSGSSGSRLFPHHPCGRFRAVTCLLADIAT